MSDQCTLAGMETDCILGFTGKILASRSREEMVALDLAPTGTTPGTTGTSVPGYGLAMATKTWPYGSH